MTATGHASLQNGFSHIRRHRLYPNRMTTTITAAKMISKMTDFKWISVKLSEDKTTIIKTFNKDIPVERVHAKLEMEYPDGLWDWTVDDGEVDIFQNHWRVQEKMMLEEGKSYEEIWKREALGKMLRMASFLDEIGQTDSAIEHVLCWAKCVLHNRELAEKKE